MKSRGVEKSVGQLPGKWAATYQVDGPLGRLSNAVVDCVVAAIAGAAPPLATQRSYESAFAADDQTNVTGLATLAAPAAGEMSDGALLLQEGWVVIKTEALALLLLPFGSAVSART